MNLFEKISSFFTAVATVIVTTIATIFPSIAIVSNNPNVLFQEAVVNFNSIKTAHIQFNIISAQPPDIFEQTGESDIDPIKNSEKSSYLYSSELYIQNIDWVQINRQSYYLRINTPQNNFPTNKWVQADESKGEKLSILPPGFFSLEIYGDIQEFLNSPKEIEKVISENDAVYKFRFLVDFEDFFQKLKNTYPGLWGIERFALDPHQSFFVTIDKDSKQIIEIEQNTDLGNKTSLSFSNFNESAEITKPIDNEQLAFSSNTNIKFDSNCPTPHNESKKYSIAEAATYLGSLLKIGLNNSYNKFKCDNPQNPAIPQKARNVYQLSKTWNPTSNSEDYIQCVAFVYMAFNMANNPGNKVRGNAVRFAGKEYKAGILVNNDEYKDQFNIFESGNTKEMPRVGDLMIWKDHAPYGHVGIITKINTNLHLITANGSNTPKLSYTYEYWIDENGKITISTDKKWRPGYWSRKK